MTRLALASLRRRVASVLATFLAVLVGVGMFAAAGGVFESALRLDAPPQRLAAAPVLVGGATDYEFANHSGRQTLPERARLDPALAGEVASAPGVERVVTDASFPAVLQVHGDPVNRGDEPAAGHPWSAAALTPYRLQGRAPSASDEIALDSATAADAGVRVGDPVLVVTDGVRSRFTVTGLAHAAHGVASTALFFSDARGHAPDALGVFPAPGTGPDAVAASMRHRLPHDVVAVTGTDRGRLEHTGVGGTQLPLFILAAVFGGLVVVVMGIVVAATSTLSIHRRRRELALLRATGATPRQTRRLVVAEGMLVATLAAAGGVGLARYAGRGLFGVLQSHGIVPVGVRFHQGPLPYLAAVLVGMVAVRVAVWLAARPAERVTPVEALREAALPDAVVHPLRRTLAGILALVTVGMAAVTVFMSPANASAIGGQPVLTGSIAVALVGPLVVRWVASRYAASRHARRDATGRLAAVNLRARSVQYAAVLAPITIATAIGLGNVYTQTTQDHAARSAYLGDLSADVVVTSDSGGLPTDLADRLADRKHVAGASAMVTSVGWLDRPFDSGHLSDPLRVLGVSAQHGRPTYTAKVRSGSLADLRPGTVALPHSLAEKLHLHVGRHVRVRLGDGDQVAAEVVAVVDQPRGYEQIVLPASVVAAHTTTGLASSVLVRTSDPDAVTAEVGHLQPGTEVGGPDLLRSQFDAGVGVEAWIYYLVALLALAYAALAIVNTLAVSILDRRRELGLHRLSGATRTEVRRVLLREVSIVGVVGFAAGTAIALVSTFPIAIASGRLLPSGPLWVLLAAVAVTAALLVPVTAVSGRLAMRRPAAEVVAEADG